MPTRFIVTEIQAVLFALVIGVVPVSAQDTAKSNGGVARAQRISNAPVIDGRLSEQEWQSAAVIEGFVQREPFDGAPVSERTVVRVLFDAGALYVGAWLADREPESIVVGETRRDAELVNSDAFRILLDTYLDRQNGYVFGTTPAGIEYDGQVTREGQGGFSGQVRQQSGSGGGFNLNWDGSWQVATSRDSTGWYAEFRIPFATLRYDKSGAQRWGLNFARHIRRRNEEALWSPVPRQFDFYRVSMAGLLDGIEAPARLPFTVTPYVLGAGRRDYTLDDTNTNWELGGDAKVGLTQSLTLDLTANTDFAQVEVDEQQINLTRFNLFFPEKRPFFLENAGTFAVGTPQDVELFFSRRIGIDDDRRAVPIVGGGRLTGRLAGFNVGALNLQTEDDNNYGAFRLLRELGNRTRLGGILVSRINTDSTHDRNISAAIDGRLGLGASFTVDGYIATTDKTNIDQGEMAGAVSASYNSRNWDFGATYREVGENFEPEVGFVSRTAYAFRSGRILRRIRPQGVTWFRELRPHISYREHLDLDGFSETRLLHFDSHFEFANGAFFQLPAINLTREGLKEPFRIAPGVVVPPGTYDNIEWGFDYNTNRAARVYVDGRMDIGGFYSGHRAGGETVLSARVGESFVASVRSTYYRVWLREGDFRTHVLGVRTAYSFSPRVYLQALLQYNQQTESFSSNLRFGWLGTAGTGLYIVYNDVENTGVLDRWARPLDRTLVVKFTRQFGIR